MNRENYYLLLELKLNPPEEDPAIIEDAIKKKQAEWSRVRNHPTKGLSAKHNIGLIPDIKKILLDPKSRKKELQAALKLVQKDEKVKHEGIERHIRLLMSKGSITKKEISQLSLIEGVDEAFIKNRLKKIETIIRIDRQITSFMKTGKIPPKQVAKLAKQFSISKEKIQERIKEKEDEKFGEIDLYLGIRSEKGFISADSITRLAKTYEITEPKILERIECPIRKPLKYVRKKARPLDEIVRNLINENLKIVGSSSLYDFLDLPENSPLDVLAEIAREKEASIRKTSSKDAVTTASGILAGQAIVSFKNESSRKSYDMTRSMAVFSKLDKDIDVAGIDGKIKDEYFKILIRSAIKLGIDLDEAVDYINMYAEDKKWTIEEKKKLLSIKNKKLILKEKWEFDLSPKSGSFWVLVGIIVAFIASGFAFWIFWGSAIQAGRIKNAYQDTLVKYEKNEKLESKQKALETFINRYKNSEYAPDIKQKLATVNEQIEKRDYKEIIDYSKKLYANKKYEDAGKIFERYLKEHTNSVHAADLKKKIEDEIPALIDDREYDSLKKFSKANYTERIKGYNSYFERFPLGRHIDDVKLLISKMVSQYHKKLKRDLAACERNRNWKKCMGLCDAFIEKFKGTAQAEKIAGHRIKYEKRLYYETQFDSMRTEAIQMGQNFDSAKLVFEEYLKANPEAPSYVKKMVKNELDIIARKQKKYKNEENEWTKLISYTENTIISISKRIKKMESYLGRAPNRHKEEANSILTELKEKKVTEEKIAHEKQLVREWNEAYAYSRNTSNSLVNRISRMERYIRKHSRGKYADQANTILENLLNQKRNVEERTRRVQAESARIRNEYKKMQSILAGERSGRYIDNQDGTVTDTKTRLTWVLLDSSGHLGRCINYYEAIEYVKQLKTGNHQNWRLPTAAELAGIYKIRPFFPKSAATWFWSSEIIVRGWNKKVVIVTGKSETSWEKIQADREKCGTVRAVRD